MNYKIHWGRLTLLIALSLWLLSNAWPFINSHINDTESNWLNFEAHALSNCARPISLLVLAAILFCWRAACGAQLYQWRDSLPRGIDKKTHGE
jgi:hypothetical protein